MQKKLFKALGALGLLTFSAISAGYDFSDFYFFGDSLTDVGNAAKGKLAPWTNGHGKLWANELAENYGKKITNSDDGGTDYAYFRQDTNHLVNTQLKDLLSAHPTLDGNALYSIWSGANDLFALELIPESQRAEALLKITENASNNIETTLQALHDHGARYILLLNIPDLGLTPNGLKNPEQNTAAANYFNQQLLNKVNNLGFDVIQIDIFTLLQQITSNPSAYGFNNVTGYCGNKDCTGYMFFDSVHPTVAGHKVIAQYALSVLHAPQFAALLTELPMGSFTSQNRTISQNLPANAPRPASGKTAFFVGGSYSKNKQDALLNDPFSNYASNTSKPSDPVSNYAGNTTNLTTGVLHAVNEALTLGASFSYSVNQSHFEKLSNSSIDWRSSLVALFADYQFSKAYVNGIVSLGSLNFNDIKRRFVMGEDLNTQSPHIETASGRASGSLFGAHLGSGYRLWQTDNFSTGPYLSVDYTRINVDGYTEEGAKAANIAFAKQARDFLASGLGWEANLTKRIGQIDTTTHVFASFNRQWLKGDRLVGFHVASLPGSHASLPVETNQADYLSTGVNVNAMLTQQLGLGIGYEFNGGQHDLRQHNVMLNLQYRFN